MDKVELVRSLRVPSSLARHDDGGRGLKSLLVELMDIVVLRSGGW